MVQVVCTAITALATIMVAFVQYKANKEKKEYEHKTQEMLKKRQHQHDIRVRESRLSMDMMHATAKLCVGTALAIKRGHANGELDEGLKYVDKAVIEYEKFMKDMAADQVGG